MNNTPAHIALGLIIIGICGTLWGAIRLAITGTPTVAAWGLATAVLGLLLLTVVRWLERRGG
jgi:uncharacterized membrane protein YjfL (UPF0719 family)